MKLAPVALAALAASLGACTTMQDAELASTAPVEELAPDPYAFTPVGAANWVAMIEASEAAKFYESSRISWVASTYINDDTNALVASDNARSTIRRVANAGLAARYAEVAGLDPIVARKLDRMRSSIVLPAPTKEGAADELAAISTSLARQFNEGRGTLDGQPIDSNDLQAEMGNLAHSPDQLKEMWASWHDNVGAPMKGEYIRQVELANQGAQELGYADLGAMWRSNYDMDPDQFAAETERIWQEVKPLYIALHTYVRSKLNEKYGDKVQPATGPIRADLLGNLWAQEWGNIYPLVAPKGAGDIGYDLTKLIEKKGLSELDMVRTGEQFFTSLGFAKLPESFWQNSQFMKPADRTVDCYASAWDLDNQDDVRIKMCILRNADDFVTIHHELGHNFYQRAYKGQDFTFLDSANDGFHEAIGDMIALSITPEYLVQIDMLDPKQVPSADKDIGLLLRQAMDKVAFLPFGLLVDRYRWSLFDGSVPPEDYNEQWTSLRYQYQGVVPPVTRGADAFDAGAKYHVPGNVPYTRYFLARVLQFQFYKAACDQAGWEGPLHRCSFYGNEEVGKNLNAMLEMGASKPWPDALEAFTGERQMSGKALVEYFAPLKAWLDEQNKGKPQGW